MHSKRVQRAREQRNDLTRAFREIEIWHQQVGVHPPATYPQGWRAQAKGNTQSALERYRKWLERQG